MKEKFTTLYISTDKKTITGLLLFLSLGMLNVVISREIFEVNAVVVSIWGIYFFLMFFYLVRHRVFVNKNNLFFQGSFLEQDQDILVSKMSDIKHWGHQLTFTYDGTKYKVITSRRLIKYIDGRK